MMNMTIMKNTGTKQRLHGSGVHRSLEAFSSLSWWHPFQKDQKRTRKQRLKMWKIARMLYWTTLTSLNKS